MLLLLLIYFFFFYNNYEKNKFKVKCLKYIKIKIKYLKCIYKLIVFKIVLY